MRIRTKIFLGYFIAAATALYFMMQWVKDDVRVRYLEAVEENMVDMVNTLASFTEHEVKNGQIDVSKLKKIYPELHNRQFKATIYDITKTTVDSQIYVTDDRGIVLFDSGNPVNIGEDFSEWNDVKNTLKGIYGVRATRLEKDNPASLVLHISSPVMHEGKIIGVITVYKPINFLVRFINLAEKRIMINAAFAFILLLLLGLIISTWLTTPVMKLKRYVDNIKDGKKAAYPSIGKGEIGELAISFEEMREALEGKKYVEEYVQNLTHELKSPLSGIQGALELLSEKDVPTKQKEKFISNMQHESKRMRQIVDRMLLLSQLENINTIQGKTEVDIIEIINEILNSIKTTYPGKEFVSELPDSAVTMKGDRLFLYEAIDNILKNAVEFTDEKGKVSLKAELHPDNLEITVSDNGAGIPEYAIKRAFEKFFSLPRPATDEKSSGLGLSITKEIIELHSGTIHIESTPDEGTEVTIKLPV